MPRIEYVPKRFNAEHTLIIERANEVCEDYREQGYDLTLRQLYYQFVSRDWLPNNDRSYKRLGSIINDARLAGELDWNYITDRTRNLRGLAHWANPAAIMDAVAGGYAEDKWSTQPFHIEVWVEKDALVGVLERICNELDVPYFSCRGYTSQSEIWAAAMRLKRHSRLHNQTPYILHLGDHDPSGIDMSRDIRDRLTMFYEGRVKVDRIALNMDQVEEYNPPPNPAKLSDSRSTGYVEEHGDYSWELDALDPDTISTLIRDKVMALKDHDAWDAAQAHEDEQKKVLTGIVEHWDDVAELINDREQEQQ